MNQKHVVITGSTRGIGFGLAESFLRRGCSLTVSGRTEESARLAATRLKSKDDSWKILPVACDVSDNGQIQRLWEMSQSSFGKIDIWINNAGWSGEEGMVWERPADEAAKVVTTNLIGTMYGARVAMQGMLKQGFGAIYNMQGMGADGRKHAGLTAYGTTKYAAHYFTESLALEAKGTPIIIGGLRPGMVVTDLITDRYKNRKDEWERAKKIFNILAERTETVTPWLADRMLANTKNGAIISYSSMWKLLWRFVSSPLIKRNLFE